MALAHRVRVERLIIERCRHMQFRKCPFLAAD
jgi:hypothetical protein